LGATGVADNRVGDRLLDLPDSRVLCEVGVQVLGPGVGDVAVALQVDSDGADPAIRGMLLTARQSGAAIVLISEDLEEAITLSDRLMVMYHGQIVGELHPGDTSVHEIGLLMTGHRS
jgi:hypothetical protein